MLKVFSFAAVLVPCLSALASAQEYSADGIAHNDRGQTAKSRIFVELENVRVEPVGAPSYEILNTKTAKGYFIVPAKKLSVEQSPEVAQMSIAPYSVGPDPCANASTPSNPATCKKLGVDKIDGRPVEKWQMTRALNGKPLASTIWVDRSLHAVVASESKLGSFRVVNLHFGKQPAALFEIPAGFKRTEMNYVTFTPVKPAK